jgi:glycosyltransferase involved in cell wall biosynthesis
MQICLLTTFPDPNRTDAPRGGYRRNMEMLRLLATQYQPVLIVAAPSPFQVEALASVCPTVVSHPRMPLRWLKVFRFLYTHCSAQTPLICYNPSLHALPALWLRWLGRPVIVDYVDVQGTVVESERPLLRRLGGLVETQFVRSCEHFVTSSAAIAERIQRRNPAAKIHMYRGTFHPPLPLNTSRSLPDLPPGVVKVMYLGMIHDFSGVRELLRAFAALVPVNAHLYLVGHGPAKRDCIRLAQQLAPGSVSFPELDDSSLHPFMSQMDILTVPYLDVPRNQTNFPSKIIEYLWSGKAILATQVGEIRHALEDEQTALLVSPSETGLQAGLRRLLGDARLRHRLGANARAEFERAYSPQTAGQGLNAFVASVQD